jgi:hypothetical protein
VEVEVEGREEVVVVVLDQDLGQVMVLGLDPGAVKDMVLVVVEEVEAEAVAEVEVVALVEAMGQVLAMGLVAAQAMVLVVG